MKQKRRKIAVVGGGTAGWLSALILQKAFASTGPEVPEIILIESPNIPTVGVGEGSTSVFRQVLFDLEIDEKEFLRETGATIKFGIRHAGWRKDRKSYFGPIDDPNTLSPVPPHAPSNWLHHARIRSGKDAAGAHLFTSLMRLRKAPMALQNDRLVPLSAYHHAYHFDQARLGKFLAKKAKNIRHHLTEIEGVTKNAESGHITHLNCSEGEAIEVDFVIDCSGFRQAIITKIGADWQSYSDMLWLNKAMPFWLKHQPGQEIAPFTDARAMAAGWMWSIPLQERMGCGYVFSDAHTTPEQAKQEVESRLKCEIEPRGVITMDPGRLKRAWVGNCVAMGLSQSFLEPLEATSIHGTIVQALLLTSNLSSLLEGDASGAAAKAYNEVVGQQIDDFANFINIHYAGGRTDTAFWRDIAQSGIAERQQAALKFWSKTGITSRDFKRLPLNLPHVEEQLYLPVLDGLGLLPKAPSKAVLPDQNVLKEARGLLDQHAKEFRQAARHAMGHREYLEYANSN